MTRCRLISPRIKSSPALAPGCDWKWLGSCRLKPAFRPQWNAGFSRQPRSAHPHLITPICNGLKGRQGPNRSGKRGKPRLRLPEPGALPRSTGRRASFQPAGSSGILPEVSGMMRRSNTNSRLEAAATGRQDACLTSLDIWRGTKGRMFAPGRPQSSFIGRSLTFTARLC